MRIGVMQPYFLPYLGYFQLIASVDLMLLADDFFFRRGYVNRNRILVHGAPAWLTLPINKPSQNKTIGQHQVCLDAAMRKRLLRRLGQAYGKAPCYHEVMPLIEDTLPPHGANLASSLLAGIRGCCRALRISTPVRMISASEIASAAAGASRILALCKHYGAREYLNLPGGRSLYSPQTFRAQGVRLGFIEPNLMHYPQVGAPRYHPRLSVLDFLMNVDPDARADFHRPFGIDWSCA